VKHSYYSLDNGVFTQDLIRCLPSFHAWVRFDTVLVSYEDTIRPARLHLVFEFRAHGIIWQAALVSYFTPLRPSTRDQDIGMKRYKEEATSSIVSLAVIIRSCYMAPTSVGSSEFYLNDFVSGDVDLYLRVEQLNNDT
jgi:hypothetical protein